MTDKTSNAEKPEDVPVGGERLRAARQARDISVWDVAKELHLDEHKVRALEKNDFEVLGAPVFAKGHLRKYAELVGVDTDDVMTDYYQMNRDTGAPPVVGPKHNILREVEPTPWVLGGLGVVIVIALVWWFFGRVPEEPVVTNQPARSASLVAAETGVEDADKVPVSQPADPAPLKSGTVVDVSVAQGHEPEETVADELPGYEVDYEPTPDVLQVALNLVFTGDCWTEVSDGAGRRLHYDLGHEGDVVNITGDEPLGVILGDVENVSLMVDGMPYSIPRSAVRDRLARLTIASSQ